MKSDITQQGHHFSICIHIHAILKLQKIREYYNKKCNIKSTYLPIQ